jgi:hypothetical protein
MQSLYNKVANKSGWSYLISAEKVNGSDYIAGYGYYTVYPNSAQTAFILAPNY